MNIDKLLNPVDVEPRPARRANPPKSSTSISTGKYHGWTSINPSTSPAPRTKNCIAPIHYLSQDHTFEGETHGLERISNCYEADVSWPMNDYVKSLFTHACDMGLKQPEALEQHTEHPSSTPKSSSPAHVSRSRPGEDPRVKYEHHQPGEESERTISSTSFTLPTSQIASTAPETPVCHTVDITAADDAYPGLHTTLTTRLTPSDSTECAVLVSLGAKIVKMKEDMGSSGSISTSTSTTMPTREETLEQAKRFKELYPAYKARHEELLDRGTPLSEQERKEIGVMRGRLVGLKGVVERGTKHYAIDGMWEQDKVDNGW